MAKDTEEAIIEPSTGWGFKPYEGATVTDPQEAYQKPASEEIYYYDREGNFQYGARPEQVYYDHEKGAMVEGVDPNWQEWSPEGDLSLGGPLPEQAPRPVDLGPTPPPGDGGGQPPLGGVGPPGGGGPPQAGLPGEGWGTNPGGDPFVPPYQGTDDTTWEWGQGPVGGEYFGAPPTFNAQTMPGEDSPWGVPGTPGGNKQFYRQQFSNLLSGQNAFDKAQITAAMRRQEAAENPREVEQFDWSGTGLKDVTLGTGKPTPTSFDFNQDYAGMSLGDIWGQVQGFNVFDRSDSSKSTQDVLNNYFNDPNRYTQNLDFSSYGSAGEAFAAINPESWAGMNRPAVAQEGLRTILNQIYNPVGQGPTAPVGYAAPI